jgi:hypothetical protein
VDVLDCPRCHARMRIVAAVTEPGTVERILRHLGVSAQPPAVAGPRAPPHNDAEAEQRQLDLVGLDSCEDASSRSERSGGASLTGVAFESGIRVFIFARQGPGKWLT